MSLDLNLGAIFQKSQILPVGSVNDLICLWQLGPGNDNTYTCNPITREYMILPRQQYYKESCVIVVYGFGVGSLTGEYKVIPTFQGDIPPDPYSSSRPSLLEAEVYTLGTGHWRSLGHVPYWLAEFHKPFLNGHVHWIVADQDSPENLCAFDFDRETFQLLPSPPPEAIGETEICFQSLGVLKGCFCQSYASDSEFMIWVMKQYGVKNSWHKEVVIKPSIKPNLDWLLLVSLIEGLKDGSVLMVYDEDELLAYCPKTKTLKDTEVFHHYFTGMVYRPSFLRLQNFELERVDVLQSSADILPLTPSHHCCIKLMQGTTYDSKALDKVRF